MAQLPVNDVARMKGVSVRTVYRAVTDGRLRAERIGRAVLIPSEAAAGWFPMITKARPQIRADEQLRSTLETVIGLSPLESGRHIGLALADKDAYRDYLQRLMKEAAARQAALTIAVSSLSTKEAADLAKGVLGAADAARIQFLASADTFADPASLDPMKQARAVRDLVEAGLANASQSWYSGEVSSPRERLLDPARRNAWATFEAIVTRSMRHVAGLAITVVVGEHGLDTLAAFAACYPQCVLGGKSGFVLRATPLVSA